ncbi:OmpH family outer membrane protein [Candidatus Pelagibacter sp. FZCC0015]|uniref:OmpH family outer membrane protein n=1 Tax=Candidatus Pelagibacter sp. FZCC0015 TaxID=2268451 RepID=UPI0011A8F9C1|nr:OmpH family outer membrane protein [Candidatus Pelagibacter sp. FZCC0015]
MKKKFFFFHLILFFFYLTSYSNSGEKVAFIDLDYIVKNSNLGREVLKEIDELNKKNLDNLNKKQEELKNLELELNKKKNILSTDELNKEIGLLKNKINKYNEEKNLLVSQFTKFKNSELDKLMNKINPIVQDYMKENSIEILFDRKNIYIGDVNSDLTKIIINELNKIN